MSRDVAVVGMSGVFPEARNLAQFWWNNVNGVDAVTDIPPGRWPGPAFHELPRTHMAHIGCSRGGFIPSDLRFDARGFGVMPNILQSGDPDQFVALQVVADALADAGLAASNPVRDRTDVIIGRGGYVSKKMAESFLRMDAVSRMIPFLQAEFPQLGADEFKQLEDRWQSTLPSSDQESLSTLIPNLVASRVSNRLDLRGSAYVVDAACASSLIAVEEAVDRLRTGRCDLAVAAGLHLCQIPPFWLIFTQLRAISTSGMSRPFDRRADGLILGEGAGAMVLKRWDDALRDQDRVYAVIKGVGSASDGRDTAVLAPSSKGQVEALRRAYRDAELDPLSISYLEGHGTSTAVGDQVEIETIRSFYGTTSLPMRTLGSVKSMIGHAMPAAGIASLVRTILALSNKVLPPTLHCEEPRKELRDAQFCVNAETRPWLHPHDGPPRRAGVNAFGFGGINAHVILEEAPEHNPIFPRLPCARPVQAARQWGTEAMLLAAPSRQDLCRRLEDVHDFLERDQSDWHLADVAHSLASALDFSQPCKLALVCSSPQELRELLTDCLASLRQGQAPALKRDQVFYAEDAAAPRGKVAFLFPGMAFPGLTGNFPRHVMELCLQFPELRAAMDHCEAKDGHPEDPVPFSWILYPPSSLPPQEREALVARMQPPKIGPEVKGPVKIEPWERNLAGVGVTLSNWLGWKTLELMEVAPDMSCGTSAGDLTGLASAGVVRFEEDVLPKVWAGFHASPTDYLNPGGVAFIMAGEERLRPYLADKRATYISIYISPESVLVGGAFDELEQLVGELRAGGIFVSRLPYAPVHCPLMSHFREQLVFHTLEADKIHPPPRFPVYTALAADVFPSTAEGIRAALVDNIDRPVRFWETHRRLYDDGARIFIQAGCGTLAANVGTILDDMEDVVTVATDVETREPAMQLSLLCATLFCCGVRFNPAGLFRYRQPRRLNLQSPETEKPKPPAGVPLALAWDYAEFWRKNEARLACASVQDAAAAARGDVPTARRDAATPARDAMVPAPGGLRGQAVPPAAPASPTAPAPRPQPGPAASKGPAPGRPASRMPFMGKVLRFVPGHEIIVERILDLDEDLYLLDHHIVNAAACKPVEQCLPILPMVMMLEAMGEVASHLAPGLGMIGLENVRAYRWVQFKDTRRVTIQVEARLAAADPSTGVRRVEAQIVCEGHRSAAGTVLFSPHYREDIALQFSPLKPPQSWPVTVEEIYRDRHLLNGPVFQTIIALNRLGDAGLTSTLRVGPKHDLFASLPEPQLLTDPCVIDGAGQLVCVWTVTRDRYVLPTGMEKLEIYRPPPPPGTEVPVRLEIVSFDPNAATVHSNIEIQDGEGYVWMRIRNRTDRLLPISAKFSSFQRLPTQFRFAALKTIPGLSPDYLCAVVSGEELSDASNVWISRSCLTAEEMAAMEQMIGPRRRQYLLGRIAVKDAIRAWLVRNAPGPMVHPASIAIGQEPTGRPYVVPTAAIPHPPQISISHSEELAVALVGPSALGIDLEPLARQTGRILADFARPEEIALVQPLSASQPDEAWPTRLWCAKESVAKALGTGVGGQLFDFELVGAEPDGRLRIFHRPSRRELVATTLRDDSSVLAYSIT